MQLNFQEFGQGKPLVILHGLLGSLENWSSISRALARDHRVVAVDLRNHGRSPHAAEMSFETLAADVVELAEHLSLGTACVLGHSLGGKVAMEAALARPEFVERLVVVDIAPRAYAPQHEGILDAMLELDLQQCANRKDIEGRLSVAIPDAGVRQFLLKNARRDSAGAFFWQAGLSEIRNNYAQLTSALRPGRVFSGPTLFVRGGKSDYIVNHDLSVIHEFFPKAAVLTILEAGHWVHVEAPAQFVQGVRQFLC